jgi:cell division protein FtsA
MFRTLQKPMARRIATGIDIGTYQVKIVVLEDLVDKQGVRSLRVLGTGLAESRGLRHGYIVNKEQVTEAVREAKRQAETTAQLRLSSGFLSIGGISLDEIRASGEAIISRADQEVTELDVAKTEAMAKEAAQPAFLNRRILHDIPTEYRIDGAKVLGNPEGMRGLRIEADHLFVTCLSQHADALVAAVEDADIEVTDQMASPLAGANVLLTKEQQMKGCVLANIGAETVSIVVYDEGIPISIKVFPMGSAHVTDDIALGFRISIEEAERVKLGKLTGPMYPRKKVDDLISSRITSMLTLIDKHLKSLNRRGPLPAGIIISGGGAGQGSIVDIAKNALKLPSRVGELRLPTDGKMRDSTWAVAYGLALWGLTGDTGTADKGGMSRIGSSARRFFKQFLP